MSAEDLGRLFASQDHVARWRAERENASARLELALSAESISFLLSQHDPVHRIGMDREALRVLLSFVRHHDKHRLAREVDALLEGAAYQSRNTAP